MPRRYIPVRASLTHVVMNAMVSAGMKNLLIWFGFCKVLAPMLVGG